MKAGFSLVNCSRIGVSFLLFLNVQLSVPAANGRTNFREAANSGLLPIERSTINPDIVSALFPIDNASDSNTSSSSPTNPGNGGNNTDGNVNRNNFRPKFNNGNNVNNQNIKNMAADGLPMESANLDEQFRCNIFENTPYDEILSAVNALNQAVKSTSCSGNSKMDVKGITDTNKRIEDAVTSLRGFVENPSSVQAENSAEIINNVDLAIRAANSLATTFAQTDLFTEQCRSQMNGGQIVTSLSDIMNGLTPYALMAAQMTGGTAAVPFIVGGAIATGAISSMSKIIEENSVKISDSQVRRAIVENTCQFIRLDQKYKFLIKGRNQQMKQITEDLSKSQALFSTQLSGVSGATQGIVSRKKMLDQTFLSLKESLSTAQSQLDLDKKFMSGTTDEIKMCQLGVQMVAMSKNKASYVSSMLGSLDTAMAAYGTTNIAQAQALKASADFAIKSLEGMTQKKFSVNTSFTNCAKVTKSFIETVDKAGSLSSQLVKLAQADIEKRVKGSKDYGLLKQSLDNLSTKQIQAERVAGSLENLRNHATKITQSEIDSEMDRLRKGLLAPRMLNMKSPVQRWFSYVQGLHQADVSKFKQGLDSLRVRAFNMTPTGKASNNPKLWISVTEIKSNPKDRADALQLTPFNLQTLPLGTKAHDDTCREMQDVWSRWVTAVDHLSAMDSFCAMIEPYIYDNRKEDQDLVITCRGFSEASGGRIGASSSMVGNLKNQLVTDKTRDWALFLDRKIKAMVCVDSTAGGELK